IRTDSQGQHATVSNIAQHSYAVNVMIPTFVGPVTFTRGWATADVTIDDTTFRFANTHLEAFASAIRFAQASELIAGAVNTELPVILTGDFNSAPGSPTYSLLAS